MERTISGMMGKGSDNHNTRAFHAKNVDAERTKYNVEFCHENIKTVYHKIFDEALERYNAKQTRKDRKIDNYYEKIRQSKQEKLFHEVIFQIGNKDDMNARSEDGQLAKRILTDFMEDFGRRNPNLYVFSAYLHMDEETPHVHIDFIPFIRDSKRGLDTRVSLKGALAAQGFKGGTRSATEWNQWIESEKQELAAVMERYGVKWLQKGTHNKHLSVLDYEKQERVKEVAALDNRIAASADTLKQVDTLVAGRLTRAGELDEIGTAFEKRNDRLRADNAELEKEYVNKKRSLDEISDETEQKRSENDDLALENYELKLDNKIQEQQNQSLEQQNQSLEQRRQELEADIEAMTGTKTKLEQNVRIYDEDAEWQLPEAGVMQSAKAYRDKIAFPLVKRLKDAVKSLTVQCIRLMEEVKRLTEKINSLSGDAQWYKNKAREQYDEVVLLREKASDLECVKRYAGADRVQAMIDSVKAAEQLDMEQDYPQRGYYYQDR